MKISKRYFYWAVLKWLNKKGYTDNILQVITAPNSYFISPLSFLK